MSALWTKLRFAAAAVSRIFLKRALLGWAQQWCSTAHANGSRRNSWSGHLGLGKTGAIAALPRGSLERNPCLLRRNDSILPKLSDAFVLAFLGELRRKVPTVTITPENPA